MSEQPNSARIPKKTQELLYPERGPQTKPKSVALRLNPNPGSKAVTLTNAGPEAGSAFNSGPVASKKEKKSGAISWAWEYM